MARGQGNVYSGGAWHHIINGHLFAAQGNRFVPVKAAWAYTGNAWHQWYPHGLSTGGAASPGTGQSVPTQRPTPTTARPRVYRSTTTTARISGTRATWSIPSSRHVALLTLVYYTGSSLHYVRHSRTLSSTARSYGVLAGTFRATVHYTYY